MYKSQETPQTAGYWSNDYEVKWLLLGFSHQWSFVLQQSCRQCMNVCTWEANLMDASLSPSLSRPPSRFSIKWTPPPSLSREFPLCLTWIAASAPSSHCLLRTLWRNASYWTPLLGLKLHYCQLLFPWRRPVIQLTALSPFSQGGEEDNGT